MTILKTIATILASCAVLTSCIKDDLSLCVLSDNTVLKINYSGDSNDPSIFGRVVDRVSLVVFDQSGRQVQTTHVAKEELTDQTVKLQLPDGATYRIVCWANVMEGSTYIKKASKTTRSGGLFEEYRLHHPNLEDDNKDIPSNDRLYVGETTCTIPVGGSTQGEIKLRGANCAIEVYVEGFGQKNNPTTYPIIELLNLMPQYDMEAKPTLPSATSYFPITELDTNRDMPAAKLYTLQFGDQNPIAITVKDPTTKEVLSTIDLQEYMRNNKLSIDNKNERKVSILVKSTDLGVSVTLPQWESVDVDPEAE